MDKLARMAPISQGGLAPCEFIQLLLSCFVAPSRGVYP